MPEISKEYIVIIDVIDPETKVMVTIRRNVKAPNVAFACVIAYSNVLVSYEDKVITAIRSQRI